MKFSKKFLVLVIGIIVILSVVSIFLLINNTNVQDKDSKEYMNLNFEDRVSDLESFDSENYYKVGWLQVQGTNIDFPILNFSSIDADLDYSYGWLSPAYITGENREVLLGHNVLNVSSTPMLSNENLQDFEALMSFSYFSFAEENLYIQYTKNGVNEIYLIYAIGFYDYTDDDGESFSDSTKIKDYIDNARSDSIYDYDVEVDEGDSLLTLKTCTRYFGSNEKQQFIIDARKIRSDEEILKYKVEKNENFDQLINSFEMN